MKQTVDRRSVLLAGGAAMAAPLLESRAFAQGAKRKPNVIVVLCDDLGYGDIGAYGAKSIATPNLDRMAKEGAKLTTFFASANICTPSRAGLLTGRYPIRTGLAQDVIRQTDTHGLPLEEVTIAEALKPDYATALVGKWHLGHVTPFWPPTVQGFDLFFGLPYSHDMKPLALYDAEPGVELTQEDVDFAKLTQRFFDRGMKFIEDNKARPFFLMLALTAPHEPLVPNPDHAGHSKAANYGDVVEEVDASVGAMMAKLKALGIDRDTMVIVTSDNGPWFQGSAGSLRERKGGAAWDGGYRVPFIARHPGVIPAGRTSAEMAMNIDLLPTILAAAGMPLPGVELDGRDISALLKVKGAKSPHDELLLFDNQKIAAVRTARWKYAVRSYYRIYDVPLDARGYTMLIDLKEDPREDYDVSARHADVLADMKARLERGRAKYEGLAVTRTAPK